MVSGPARGVGCRCDNQGRVYIGNRGGLLRREKREMAVSFETRRSKEPDVKEGGPGAWLRLILLHARR